MAHGVSYHAALTGVTGPVLDQVLVWGSLPQVQSDPSCCGITWSRSAAPTRPQHCPIGLYWKQWDGVAGGGCAHRCPAAGRGLIEELGGFLCPEGSCGSDLDADG